MALLTVISYINNNFQQINRCKMQDKYYFQQDDKNEEQIQKKHQQLIYKISYQDDPEGTHPRKYKYSNETLIPFLYFYKLLAFKPCERNHKHQLQLNIPDTIVFNDGDNPVMWFYTNDKGKVARIDNIPYFQIINKFCQGAFDKELVAVLKKPSYGYGGPSGNQIKTVSASQIKTVLSLILGNRSEISVIQRFVKSCSIKPSIVRTCWRATGNNQSWTLYSNYPYTSKAKVPQISKFIVNTKLTNGFRAVKNVSQKFTKETLKYVKNIVDFVSRNLKIKFKEFVCDFVKDEAGNWWFLNVKAFILENEEKVNLKPIVMHDDQAQGQQKQKKNLETYTKCKKCKYCNKIIADHLMNHKLTLMMILQCDQHLIRLGKSFQWLDRCYQYHVSTVNLYVQHKVCDSCFKLYTEVLKLVQLEEKMSKLTGVTIKNDNKNIVSITSIPAFKGQSPKFGSRFRKITYETDMPRNWGLPAEQKIQFSRQKEAIKSVKRCKFMVFIHGLRDIPFDGLEKTGKYSLSYSFLNQTIKFTINLENSEQIQGMLRLKINKMKTMYFFIESRDDIVGFIKKQNILKIQLFRNEELMGYSDLQLEDLKSDKVIRKDYFKMFSGQKIFPFLSWGIFVSLGLHEGELMNGNSLKLVRYNSILLPELGYHSPGLLPQEWVQMIKDKPDSTKKLHTEQSEYELQNRSIHTNSENERRGIFERQVSKYETDKKRAISQNFVKRKVYY